MQKNSNFPANLPVIIEDELFLYPFMITPVFISDEKDLKSLNAADEENSMIMIVSSKTENSKDFNEIYHIGVIGSILRKVDLGEGKVKILFQGHFRGKILEKISDEPLICAVDIFNENFGDRQKIDALINVLKEKVKNLSLVSNTFPPDLLKTIEESSDHIRTCDLIASSLRLKRSVAYSFFSNENLEDRIYAMINYISEEIEANKLEKEIKNKVHLKIDKTNKEYFLKEQLKQIQKELGSDNDKESEVEEYRQKLKIKKKFLNDDGYKEIKKQIDKFSRIHPDSSDSSMIQSYLDWILEIPFEKISKKELSMQEVSKQLDKDHYALNKPKERIEEYFALRELLSLRGIEEKINNGAILCFVGPPGVGKTSLANSIATALKRELVRIALGGLEDVNELRGHRRTYIGSMPGRIVQGLIEAKQMNPVMVLDEIDKISKSYKGDPTAVFLEILDPEQNNKFRDYYVNFNIDLSKIIFIATANDISAIPAPLRDRMEFIELNSYTPQEKFEIAKKYLIPQEIKKHGLKPSEVSINSQALTQIIEEYTRESGVRNLRRKIADICRKSAVNFLKNKELNKISITPKNLNEFLDKKVFEIEKIDNEDEIGIVNGLAWTSVGGDVLKIESIKIKGKGNLQITGQLGDVMKESAQIAFSLVKTLFDTKKIKINKKYSFDLSEEELKQIYKFFNLHIHVPEGATPKDGPSAGITMTTAIVSILTEKKVRKDIAMTGEITLSGKVLPIGGLKEKLIAAYKAKIKKVLIPKKNYERDLDEIPQEVKDNLEIIPVSRIEEVLQNAIM